MNVQPSADGGQPVKRKASRGVKKAAPKKAPKDRSIPVRADEELMRLCKAAAEKDERSLSDWVRRALGRQARLELGE